MWTVGGTNCALFKKEQFYVFIWKTEEIDHVTIRIQLLGK